MRFIATDEAKVLLAEIKKAEKRIEKLADLPEWTNAQRGRFERFVDEVKGLRDQLLNVLNDGDWTPSLH